MIELRWLVVTEQGHAKLQYRRANGLPVAGRAPGGLLITSWSDWETVPFVTLDESEKVNDDVEDA